MRIYAFDHSRSTICGPSMLSKRRSPRLAVVMIYASKGYFKSKSERGAHGHRRAYSGMHHSPNTAQPSAPTLAHACTTQTASAKQTRPLEQVKRFCVAVDLVRGGAPLSEVEAECNKKMRDRYLWATGREARRDRLAPHSKMYARALAFPQHYHHAPAPSVRLRPHALTHCNPDKRLTLSR